MSEIRGQSGHALPDLQTPLCANYGSRDPANLIPTRMLLNVMVAPKSYPTRQCLRPSIGINLSIIYTDPSAVRCA